MAAARIQRWAVFLAGYNFTIVHIKGEHNTIADSLSRLPLPSSEDGDFDDFSVEQVSINQIEILPILPEQLRFETMHDTELLRVLDFTRRGWPTNAPSGLLPYFVHRTELSCDSDSLFWGLRVIIPTKL